MTTADGGWIVAGWQPSNSTTTLGLEDRGEVGDPDGFSADLTGCGYNEMMVFNVTYGEHYEQAFPASEWGDFTVNYAVEGEGGTDHRQGTYGPGHYMMVCLNYTRGLSMAWACDNDSRAGQLGHIADYAGEFCGPRLDGTWAWTDGETCMYRGEAYTYGLAIR
jgi:hypothetical protein